MCFWDKNLEALGKRYPAVEWDKVLVKEEGGEEEVWSASARDGSLVLYMKRNGKEYRVNSAFRPIDEAKRWASKFEIKGYEARVIMFGFGNGYLIRELMEKFLPDTILLVFEPDIQVFQHILEYYDVSDILESEQVWIFLEGINGKGWDDSLNRYFKWENLGFCIPCVHLFYDTIYQKQCLEFYKSVDAAQRLVVTNTGTAQRLGKVGSLNTLHNMKEMMTGSVLYDLRKVLPKNVAAIVVAAGPSLDYNVEELRAAKGHAVIIAVDKAAKTMLEKGIEPDFLITLDPLKLSRYLEDERLKTLPLLAEYSANRKITENHPGHKIFYGTGAYMDYYLGESGKAMQSISSGGSVATAAFTVCLLLGLQKVILVGQDLAYRDGATHSGGRFIERKQGVRRFKVDGALGGQVETRNDWLIYLTWFGKAIEANPHMKVVDATEGGAKIPGAEVLTLKEAIRQYCTEEVDCQEMMGSLELAFTEEQFAHVKEGLQEDSAGLEEIQVLAEKNVELAERLIKACRNGTIDKPEYAKLIKRVSEYKDEIVEKRVYAFLNEYIAGESEKILMDINAIGKDQMKDEERIYTRTKQMYEMVMREAKELKQAMDEAVEAM